MSHEIRTPLAGVIGFAEVLAEEVADEHREAAELIRQSGVRLLDTLNSVLDLARLEANAVDLTRAPLDVAAEVAVAADLFRSVAERKGLRFEARLAPTPATLDASCLHRIASNLLANAVKFTTAGAITVAVWPEAGGAALRVTDTGTGMDAAFLPHLFDEFRQESTGLNRTHQGTGLGLAITKRLVDLLGGTITVASTKGVGTAFTVRFPGARA